MHKAIMWREVTVGLVVLAACCEHGDRGRARGRVRPQLGSPADVLRGMG